MNSKKIRCYRRQNEPRRSSISSGSGIVDIGPISRNGYDNRGGSITVQSAFVSPMTVMPSAVNSPSHQELYSKEIHRATSMNEMDRRASDSSAMDPSFINAGKRGKDTTSIANNGKHPQIVIDLRDGGSNTRINIKSNFCPGSERTKSHNLKAAESQTYNKDVHVYNASTMSLGTSSNAGRSTENVTSAEQLQDQEYMYAEENRNFRPKRKVCRDSPMYGDTNFNPNVGRMSMAPRMSMMPGGRLSMMPAGPIQASTAPRLSMAPGGRMSLAPGAMGRMSMAPGGGRMSMWGGRMSMMPGMISASEMVQDYPEFLDCGAEDCLDVLEKRALRSGTKAVRLQNMTHATAAERLADKADSLAVLRATGVKLGNKRVTIAPEQLEFADVQRMSISPPGRMSVAPNGTLMSIQPDGRASAANLRMSMAQGRTSMAPGRMSMSPTMTMGASGPAVEADESNPEPPARGYNEDYFVLREPGLRRYCTNDPFIIDELAADAPLPPSVESRMTTAASRMSMALQRQSVAPSTMVSRMSMSPQGGSPGGRMSMSPGSRMSMSPGNQMPPGNRMSMSPGNRMSMSPGSRMSMGAAALRRSLGAGAAASSMVQLKAESLNTKPSSVKMLPVTIGRNASNARVKSQVRFDF